MSKKTMSTTERNWREGRRHERSTTHPADKMLAEIYSLDPLEKDSKLCRVLGEHQQSVECEVIKLYEMEI